MLMMFLSERPAAVMSGRIYNLRPCFGCCVGFFLFLFFCVLVWIVVQILLWCGGVEWSFFVSAGLTTYRLPSNAQVLASEDEDQDEPAKLCVACIVLASVCRV